jgi:hypothetical protein
MSGVTRLDEKPHEQTGALAAEGRVQLAVLLIYPAVAVACATYVLIMLSINLDKLAWIASC